MRKFRLIPDDTHIRFMWLRRFNFPASGLLAVLSVIVFIFIGPDYGIDFRGGTLIEMQPVEESVDVGSVRTTLGRLNLGDVQVQEVSDLIGDSPNILVRVEEQVGGEEAQQEALVRIREAMGERVEFQRVEVVGPRVSGELAYNGTIALLVTMVAIMIYVWFRFEWQFAIGAIIATAHDVMMTLGFFVVARLEFNLASIAAILTIVGYSLNDTVVVYDRVRENLRKFKRMSITDLLDRSVNDTLARTTMTGVTTLLALFALYIFGGTVIRSFILAMIFGVVIGTYSSVYIAAPLLIYFKLRPAAEAPASEDETKAVEAPGEV